MTVLEDLQASLRAYYDEVFKLDLAVGDVHTPGAGGHYTPIEGPDLEKLKRVLDGEGGGGDDAETASPAPATETGVPTRRKGIVTMPFVSQAQRGWMYQHHPDMAKRWEKHTPKGTKLPRHVKGKDAGDSNDAAIIIVDNGNGMILSVTRKPTLTDLGFPGGHVQQGEAPDAAAVRELWEETGIECRALTNLFAAPRTDGPGTVYVYCACAEDTDILAIPSATPEPDTRVCWVLPSELLNPSNTFAAFAQANFERLFGHLHPKVTMADKPKPISIPVHLELDDESKALFADISAAKRKSLPGEKFASPADRKYPINDAAHVRNAAARLEQQKSSMSPAKYRAIRARIASAAKRFGVKSKFNAPGEKLASDSYDGDKPQATPAPTSGAQRPGPRGSSIQVHADLAPGGRLQVRHTMSDRSNAVALRSSGVEDAAGFRLMSEEDQKAKKLVWIQLAEVGAFRGHPAGDFALTPSVFSEIVRNFEKDGIPVPIDYEHSSEQEPTSGNIPIHGAPAQGWIHRLDNRGQDGLWGLVEWRPEPAAQIRAGAYRYISPAIRFGAKDRETGGNIGAKLTSAGLTNQPFLKGMQVLAAKDRAALLSSSGNIPEGGATDDALSNASAPPGTGKGNIPREGAISDPGLDGAGPMPKAGTGNIPTEGASADHASDGAKFDDGGDGTEMQALAGAYGAFRELHAARLGAFGAFGAFAAKPAEYMPQLKAAFHLHDLSSASAVMSAFRQLRDRLLAGFTAGDHSADGVDLNSYIKPLRDIAAKDRLSATVEEILEIVEHMICAAMERHELEMHIDQLAQDDVAEEGMMSSMMQDLAKDTALAAAFGDTKQKTPSGATQTQKETHMSDIKLSDHQAAVAVKDAEIAALKTKLDAADLALTSEKGKTTEMSTKLTALEADASARLLKDLEKEADEIIANPENHLPVEKKATVLRMLKDSPEVARDLYKPAKAATGGTLPQKFVHLTQKLPPSKPGRGGAEDALPEVYVMEDGVEIDSRVFSEKITDTTSRLMSERKLSIEDAQQEAWEIHNQAQRYVAGAH